MKNLRLHNISLCVDKCLIRAKERYIERESKRKRVEERDSEREIHTSLVS